jgi:hypothetical protein
MNSIAAWLRCADHDGLAAFLKPVLMPCERAVAQVQDGYWAFPACSVSPLLITTRYRARHDIENGRKGSRQRCHQSVNLRFSGWPYRLAHVDVSISLPLELEGGDNLFQFVLREPPQISLW